MSADVRFNPLMERELVLRGLRIPAIENLGVSKDQFDTIDFTDNNIVLLDLFPNLPRLTTLILSNNKICKISPAFGKSLPQLKALILGNNDIASLEDLSPLRNLDNLERLSLKGNPVTHVSNYRLYVLHLIPHLRFLDFQKVHYKEVEKAKELFSEQQAVDLPSKNVKSDSLLTPTQKQVIRKAIEASTSLEEMDKLQTLLQSGKFPDSDSELKKLLDSLS